ncbi:MAG: hypothetical protein M1828_004061 [Chrysothrix sp. TS-e1954]|nr:MAG: hypothetical protein M1828_004061 [Chrysothrix sp. TS-e1954]
MPVKSRWTLPIPTCTLPTFLFGDPQEALPEVPALIDAERPDAYILTRNGYKQWAKRVAAGLQAAGLKPGEPVLLFSGNTIFFPVVLLGVVMAGGIFTGANPMYTAREVAYQLENSGARFLICGDAVLEVGLDAARMAGLSKDRTFSFDDGYDTFDEVGRGKMGVKHWSALIASKAQGQSFRWKEDKSLVNNTVALNFSSGTTGLPKGVEITHTNYIANGLQHGYLTTLGPKYQQHREQIRWLCFLPMYHAMGQTIYAVTAFSHHIPTYIMRKFDFVKMLECVQAFRISDLQLVPPIVVAMTKSPLVKNYDLSSVETAGAGAAPLGGEVAAEFAKLWPPGKMNLKQGYGMTETTCSVCGWDPNNFSDSFGVGEPNANCEIKLVSSETLQEVPQGERGEMWVRGPNIMKGYWKNEKATKETKTSDGWLRTGDVGVQDNKGVFFIVDRIKVCLLSRPTWLHITDSDKELIKVKGNQVAPAELEAQLLEHPGILDAAVIGVTIDGEELPRAYCVKSPGQDITPEEIIKFMEKKVARHKRLAGGVRLVEAIAKNPSGKILRKLYREQAAKEVSGSQLQAKL